MIITRYLSASSFGQLVTAGLLFMMQLLIRTGPRIETPASAGHYLEWIKLPREEKLIVQENKLSRPITAQSLPADPRPVDSGTIDVPGVPVVALLPSTSRSEILRPAFADGPPMSIFMVVPDYPAKAISRGLEGYVVVSYDVLASGIVSNVDVLESSNHVFDSAAVAAAYRFRFKPRIVDGIALETQGMQNRFVFTMDD